LAFTTAAESDCAKAVLKMKTTKKEKIKFKFERRSGCFIMISKSKLKKEFGKCNIIRGTLYAANSYMRISALKICKRPQKRTFTIINSNVSCARTPCL
jgi:hypothetical protein